MTKIPEGVKTASGEGADIKKAIEQGAAALGLEVSQVSHTLDLSHFRNPAGGSVARQTVKVIVWPAPEGAAKSEAPKKKSAKPRAKAKAEEAPAPAPAAAREPTPAPRAAASESALASTPASEAATAWFTELLPLMGLKGTVQAEGDDERVRIAVDVDHAGRLIGRRGSTLSAVRHLLRLALSEHGDFVIDVDIPDQRDGKGDRDEPKGRDRKRKGDDRKRSKRGDRRRDDDRPRSEHSEDKLQRLAHRAADKALESGKAVTISLLLNSYDRRIVHVAAQEIDGVESRSIIKDDGKKYVQIAPLFEE